MRLILLISVLMYSVACDSQNTQKLHQTLEYLLYNNIEKAYDKIKTIPESQERKNLIWHLDAFYYGIKDSLVDQTKSKDESHFGVVLNEIKEADIYNEFYINKDSIIFEKYKKAVELSKHQNDSILVKYSLNKILKYLFYKRKSYDVLNQYNNIYSNYIKTPSDQVVYDYYKYTTKSFIENKPCIPIYLNGLKLLENIDNDFLKGKLNVMLGNQESHFNKQNDSAIKHFQKAKNYFTKVPGVLGKRSMFGIYNNLAAAHNYNNEPIKALYYFDKAIQQDIPKNGFLQQSYLYLALAQTHKNLKNYDSAYFYLNMEKEAIKQHKEYENALQLTEIETKYQTEKKEKENLLLKASNLESEAKRKQNQNISIGLAVGLALVSIIAFLLFKNTKRKQNLAEKEKELETQKLATVLKEQELTTIDAMIEGQEKERQRIANDLHDDLGGLIATVKLHFNALKEKNTPELYDKTNTLIDEAYQKVRSVAHAKNSGVIAKQGLLLAVQQMAEKVSASNKITIDVIDHGLENRLENSLELTIFRIIQELVTNVIKHAEANETTVHITNHDESLNIMVEDNGIGFNPNQITKTNKGMGISSIDKRVAHLDGTMTIESDKNQGTTIIIDIPI
ncbi:ATP-binding protein [Psychroserpens ponticola]|uniref:Oxygen sensor histidine kinase NreB n=1 Tax=Psychroserpens ponticola TaxID=2932268 RepID=A0ABY7S052_9FLAO|nr:sensor histidine kinase [Psychroserpens ponticola]WCO02697.1 sensor histidine kinase [Psychroserpens ponticola]